HDIYERGASYNIPRAVCDGQDVFAVRAAMQECVDRARTESLPTLLEVRTYRFMGHSMSDAVSGTYRSKAELEEELKAVAQDAWDFADKSPEPPLEALFEDVIIE